MSDMVAKLPDMADEQLKSLHANAERLQTSGTPVQQKSAAALLPAVKAEIAARQATKLAAVREKAVARKKRG